VMTMNKSVAEPNVAVERKRESSSYYKTLVRSGYAPVNGLEMYYEIHGTVTARPLVTIHPWLGLANVFPSLTRNRQLIAVELQGHGRTAGHRSPVNFRTARRRYRRSFEIPPDRPG
jgi:pimeloyl-ACP methyl ester carboxylesterase